MHQSSVSTAPNYGASGGIAGLWYGAITFCNAVPIACQKYGKIDLKHLLQFPDQPSPILGSTENTTFVHLPKKSKYLKADFL